MLATEPFQLRLGLISIGIPSTGLVGFTRSAIASSFTGDPTPHRKHALPCEP